MENRNTEKENLDRENETKKEKGAAGAKGKAVARSAAIWAVYFAVVVLIVVLIQAFIAFCAVMSAESMAPALSAGDHAVFLRKADYKPERGDIVMFTRNDGDKIPRWGALDAMCKRVIGIPGDKIEIKDGKVYLNGEKLDEPYLAENTSTGLPSADGEAVYSVPEGCVFVLGDNRGNSDDSRFWKSGPYLSTKRVFAKHWFTYFHAGR